ncbi:MAG: cupin domain-containing protein [Gammaproteobacteria bacterium]|nr:cupin domain-containing protein [Gammaproteobacteria bacterium]
MDSREFVERYWQQKPCVLRNAIPDFESIISPEELAGLACEEDVHGRLVIEKGGELPWQLHYGPFHEQDFLNLPESHYSLLVSECEKWIPELADLADQFRFIPDWRFDDLMISYAPTGGSVGAHVNQYDVFLLQAMGSRRWQYNESHTPDAPVIEGLELAILRDFTPDQEVALTPGDILYLPPGLAHHGVALEPCMTYSIGFRAPTAANALESFALECEYNAVEAAGYRDRELELDRHPAEITDTEIERFRTIAAELLDKSPDLWRHAIGKMLSDSAVAVPDETDGQPLCASDLQAHAWFRHPETRLFYHQSAELIEVYYNACLHELPPRPELLEQLRKLCENREWSVELMRESIAVEPLDVLLLELASKHAILPVDE